MTYFENSPQTTGAGIPQDRQKMSLSWQSLSRLSDKVTVDIYGPMALGGNKEAVNGLDDDATIRNLSATKNEKELTSCG